MKNSSLLKVIAVSAAAFAFGNIGNLEAQNCNGVMTAESYRYIEVTGTSEVEIVPDEIHFILGIKEYFEEEFDGVSKPEQYRTKVSINTIESGIRDALHSIGISDNDIRIQDVGDYWRERGHDFLIGKNLDITLHDFTMIDKIISGIDTKGVNFMRIGEMSHKDILKYHEQGKVDALLAARKKAEYMAGALGEKIWKVLSIEEHGGGIDRYTVVQNSKLAMDGAAFGNESVSASDAFRTLKYTYSVTVRFALRF